MGHTIHWFHIDLAAEDIAPLRMRVSSHGIDPPLSNCVHRIFISFFPFTRL